MKIESRATYIAWRFYLILALVILVALALVVRVFDLTILNQHFLKKQGDNRVLRMVNTPAFRGMILDRNGTPLAVSTTVYSAWMNPKELVPTKSTVASLARLLKITPVELASDVKAKQKKMREFAYLKRGLSPEVANQIKALNIPGLYTQEASHRYYPEGEMMAQVIGFTNVDDNGQEGLELAYDRFLRGEPGKKWVIKDRLGRVISDVKQVQEQVAGKDLTLSLDRRIQYLAYRELLNAVTKTQAASGSVVVLDARTGEVLAMVNQPSFNPNNRTGHIIGALRNRAVTDTFEPGSTIKAFSMASAMETGKFHPDTVIDTDPGWMRVGRNVVKDEHNNGPLTVTEIMQKSSNVGVTKMVLGVQPDQLWRLLSRVGFGEITGIGFPGEQSGSLVRHHPWGAFTLATLAFGYGLSVTTLQLARAYSVLANDGIRRPVSLLKLANAPAGDAVMNAKVAQQMLGLLESVVMRKGTGHLARIPGYRVAGKTGTARMAGLHGYQKQYVASFVGIAPVSQPRLIVAVVMNDVRGKRILGGQIASPVFEKIMEESLRILNVPPDA